VSLTSLFMAAIVAWRIFWQIARLRLEGGEMITVNLETPVQPSPCSLCGGESRHKVAGESLCIGCGVGRCVAFNTRQPPRAN